MKYDHTVIHNGNIYMAGEEVPTTSPASLPKEEKVDEKPKKAKKSEV